MAAYMIVDLQVHDPEGFEKYRADVPALIAKHGGEYIVRGGEFEVIGCEWQPTRLVMFRFPDRAAIANLFNGPEYADLKALRHRVASSSVVAVDGLD